MLGLVPFLAFLQRHLISVAIDFVLIVFDNHTLPEANAISATLSALPTDVVAINEHSPMAQPINLFRFKRVLVISLIVTHFASVLPALDMTGNSNGHRFVFVLNASALEAVTLHQTIMAHQNAFYAVLQDDGRRVAFVVWHFMDEDVKSRKTADLRWLPDERAFINSIHWQLFRAQLDRIPGPIEELLTTFTTLSCPKMACNLLYRNTTMVVAGVWPGLSRLVAYAVGARRQADWFYLKHIASETLAVHFMDPRQFKVLPKRWVITDYMWSIRIFEPKFWVNAMIERFVVIAPRKIVVSSKTELMHRATTVGLFIAIAFGFTLFRFVLRSMMVGIRSTMPEFSQLFFETLSRSLGITPGRWNGSTADRVLLSVISVFAILLGSLFSGLLYGQILDDGHESYNTLLDLCAHRVPINILSHMTAHDSLSNVSPLCVTPDPPNFNVTRKEAYVVQDDHLTVDILSTHHALPQPYGVYPVALLVTRWFLRRPIQMALGRCSDHGFYQALQAAANHSATLLARRSSGAAGQPKSDGTSSDFVWNHFEFMLLAIGFMVAIVTFVGELLAGRSKKSDLFSLVYKRGPPKE